MESLLRFVMLACSVTWLRSSFIVSLILSLTSCVSVMDKPHKQLQLSSKNIPIIEKASLTFRDLNRNGKLDVYEDWRLNSRERAKDVLARMTIEEKVGQLLHGSIFPDYSTGKPAQHYTVKEVEQYVLKSKMTAFIPFFDLSVEQFADQNNRVQAIAENGRLGIPVMVSSDPRHHFQGLTGASMATEGFSRWPETLGFAALDDYTLTKKFAEIASKEYRATGFSLALSPMADLASEPRWARIFGTFGEDPEVVGRMVSAYIEGFQNTEQGSNEGRVATVVKHWVGYGAAKDGFDSHNYYGRFGDLKTEDLASHLRPFEYAFDAHVSSVMPAYSVFKGLQVNKKDVELVGAGYSEVLLQDLLRDQYDFDGVILSDWAIINDCSEGCRKGVPAGQRPSFKDISTGWGVQHLSLPERFALGMKAGIDQFGGATDPAPLLEAIAQGLISIDRVDESVQRVLERTFAIGLFENPFVDTKQLDNYLNVPTSAALALATQSRAMVVLKQNLPSPALSQKTKKVFLYAPNADVNAAAYTAAGYTITDQAEDADIVIARLHAPYETLHPGYFFGSKQHEGSLEFSAQGSIMKELRALAKIKPLIVDIYMDRPAILTEINELADMLLVNFGASDLAIINALDGTVPPEGKLPFELPSSSKAVQQQSSSKPSDSDNPLYPIGYRFSK